MTTLIVYLAEIVVAIYVFYVAINMIQFKGRQKERILAAIPDQDKAVGYGKNAGTAMMLFGFAFLAFCILRYVTNNMIFDAVILLVVLADIVVNMYFNRKYAGKSNINIY
jgi:hypothetical protein